MIEVKNLTKKFGGTMAVDGISFTVNKGEILGFLGPNGAGKSTTMRMITGFIPPTSGTAIIGGADIFSDSIAARTKMGYLPENAPVYPEMTVTSYLEYCASIRGFKGAQRKSRIEEALEKCFLKDVRHQIVGTLSKGYRQRVCFAQSILHDPEYLIMDEPTDGLDPNQKFEVREMIKSMSADKVIILSTHILDEVDALCTRAIVIAKGRVVADKTPNELRAMSSLHGAVSITLAIDDASAADGLSGVEGVKKTEITGKENGISILVYPKTPESPIADGVVKFTEDKGLRVKSIFVEQGRLDEVFRNITS